MILRLETSCVVGLLLAGLGAPPGPVLNVAQLVNDADLVVTAVASQPVEVGRGFTKVGAATVAGRVAASTFDIDATLKGRPESARILVRYFEADTPINRGYPAIGIAMYFLKRTDSHYEFVSPHYPSIVATAGLPPRGLTALEKVANVLDAVVTDPGSSRMKKLEAIRALRTTTTPAAIESLRRVMEASDVELRATAVAELLRLGDAVAVPVAAVLLMAPDVLPADGARNLRTAMSQGAWRGDSAAALATFLRWPTVEDRRAAVEGLGQTASDRALPFLAQALRDPDEEVRYHAVRGLARITGDDEGITARELFAVRQYRYLNYWESWARAKGFIK